MTQFISISGEAGAGKDTLRLFLTEHFERQCRSVGTFSFAGPLKDACCLWFGWDRQRLNDDFPYKEGGLEDDPYCMAIGKTRRQIMQDLGTECLRAGMHQDFWIILAELGLKLGKVAASDVSLIPDARFPNELQFVRRMGGSSIRVVRLPVRQGETLECAERNTLPGLLSGAGATLTLSTGHSSEHDWKTWDFDYIVVNPVFEDAVPALGKSIFERNAHEMIRQIGAWEKKAA